MAIRCNLFKVNNFRGVLPATAGRLVPMWQIEQKLAAIFGTRPKVAAIVYVLHAFQKKSKRGSKTPPQEIEKVKARLKEAEKDYAKWAKKQQRQDQDQR